MDSSTLAAWWSHRQGLDGSLEGALPAQVLQRSGWARSVAGVGPYLTLFSRAGTSRTAADAAVASLEIHELPSARGCTYVVPASDFALALEVGNGFDGDFRTAQKFGVTDKEVETLCNAIVDAVATTALSPEELRSAVGRAARSLGPDAAKKGLTTTLPLGLGRLQTRGDIRRVPVNGRLDQQRYKYVRWRPNPRARLTLTREEASTELARRYFSWIGPATLSEFQGFSALGVKAARMAIEPLKLVPIEKSSDLLMHASDVDALHAFRRPKDPQFVLVSSLDAIALLRRNVGSLLDPKDEEREVVIESRARAMGSLSDFPNHAILDRGRLIGLWEFDTATNTIVWATFGTKPKPLAAAVRRTEAFICDDLGDARSFSLDSPKSRVPKIEALRKGF